MTDQDGATPSIPLSPVSLFNLEPKMPHRERCVLTTAAWGGGCAGAPFCVDMHKDWKRYAAPHPDPCLAGMPPDAVCSLRRLWHLPLQFTPCVAVRCGVSATRAKFSCATFPLVDSLVHAGALLCVICGSLTISVFSFAAALVGRNFMEVSRSRIEGLLAAFPKLIDSEGQHTFVETDTVR